MLVAAERSRAAVGQVAALDKQGQALRALYASLWPALTEALHAMLGTVERERLSWANSHAQTPSRWRRRRSRTCSPCDSSTCLQRANTSWPCGACARLALRLSDESRAGV